MASRASSFFRKAHIYLSRIFRNIFVVGVTDGRCVSQFAVAYCSSGTWAQLAGNAVLAVVGNAID